MLTRDSATRKLALHPSSLIVNQTELTLLPGSEFGREAGYILAFARLLLARTTEVGSRTLVHAGLQGAETHGQYLSDCGITEPSVYVRSEEGAKDQERVWKELAGKLEGIKGGITKV